MEEDSAALGDDSSIEILSSSDDEGDILPFMQSSTLQSSTLQGSFFEIMSSSYLLEPMAEEATDENPDVNSNATENRISSISLDNLKPYFEQNIDSLQNSDVTYHTLASESSLMLDSGDNMPHMFITKEEIKPCGEKICVATEDEINAPTFEVIELASQSQPNKTMESYLRRVSSSEHRLDIDGTSSMTLCLENNINEFISVKRPGDNAIQLYPDRSHCTKKLYSVLKHTVKIYRWFQSNKHLQNVIAGVKSTFHNFLNTCEVEVNSMMGMGDPLKLLIIADESDSMTIGESFCKSLSGQVVISKCPEVEDSAIPVLPVGYNSAVEVVQSKINKTRKLYDYEQNTVMVTTANFIAELYSQRWQMSTVLCLEDPNLGLSLHNFTSTIPVPNEFIDRAQRLTPGDYPLRRLGLAVTLEQAIGYTPKTASKGATEIICGVDHSVNLKSAADVLAGMYNKYVNRFV